MGIGNKLQNRVRMAKGRAKAKRGRATGRPYLETKGQGQRAGGAARQVSEQVKDAVKDVRDAFKE